MGAVVVMLMVNTRLALMVITILPLIVVLFSIFQTKLIRINREVLLWPHSQLVCKPPQDIRLCCTYPFRRRYGRHRPESEDRVYALAG